MAAPNGGPDREVQTMTVQRLMVAGGGMMGSQVTWQAARHGLEVTVYDAFDAGLARCRELEESYRDLFVAERGADAAEMDAALARISYTTDLESSAAAADAIIEQVPEDLGIKQGFWERASAAATPEALLLCNSSSLVPSAIAPVVAAPERFLSLHYCVPVWDANIGEVMGHEGTASDHYDRTVTLAEQMGLVPIKIRREWPGYVLNALLIPFLVAGVELVRNGVSDPADIDQVWRICNRSEIGPCQMVDMTGMNAAYHVAITVGQTEVAEWLKREYIDKGRMGVETGAGFYDY
ncbi:3-hydroxyacyl-CoA dehydrogenase NAD-binding domain-containing protein [Nocardioides sambongensis]|uniref:3-hydroxyacyl-CoA dehydrogenase NAD-binding domain-containing protein n=1 Tax=Nocardioides sambongensis TaxID=2589074 RepID=UPI0018C87A62|nr:3-hydroxyacyl-CoA dehydrogenase NAD-binding domain-containing protein [Nocardioides sambongensis]